MGRAALAAAALGAAVVAAFVTMYLPQPLLPAIARDLGASDATSAALVSVLTLGIAVASPVLAPLSDRFGRRPLLLLATAGLVPAGLACAWAPNVAVLIGCRAVQGALVAATLTNGWAYLGEEFDRRVAQRLAGWFIAATVTGGVVSRLLGGTVGDVFGWRGAFVASAVVAAAAGWALARALPRSRAFRPASSWAAAARAAAVHWRDPSLRRLYLIGFLIFFAFLGLFNALPFRLHAPPYGWSAAAIGWIYLTYLGGAVTSPATGRWLARAGARRLVAGAAMLTALAHVATLVQAPWALVVALTALCATHFVVQSAASGLVATQTQTARAAASAHYLFSYYVGGSLGGVISVAVLQVAGWPGVVALGASAMAIAAALGARLASATGAATMRADGGRRTPPGKAGR